MHGQTRLSQGNEWNTLSADDSSQFHFTIRSFRFVFIAPNEQPFLALINSSM